MLSNFTALIYIRTYQTFSSADMHRDSISKHLDSLSNLSSSLETSVISSSTGLPGPLDCCNKLTKEARKNGSTRGFPFFYVITSFTINSENHITLPYQQIWEHTSE